MKLYKMFRGHRFIGKRLFNFGVCQYVAKCGRRLNLLKDAFIDGGKYVQFGDDFSALSGLRIEAFDYYKPSGQSFAPYIEIGDRVAFGRDCHIGAINGVKIEDDVLVGSKVLIIDHQHGDTSLESMKMPPKKRALFSAGPILIEKNVWIGDNVVIMPGVTVGRNSIIAANAVVTKAVPPFSIVGGIPAKVIKQVVK